MHEWLKWFQHAAARRRLGVPFGIFGDQVCFNTQPPEGGWKTLRLIPFSSGCFNTQPPEGGWSASGKPSSYLSCFNTQPPEGGWLNRGCFHERLDCFNTQPPEGGWKGFLEYTGVFGVSTRSRPKAAGQTCRHRIPRPQVSTRSRPKAAGLIICAMEITNRSFQHAAARRRLVFPKRICPKQTMFQHAAARRRLETFMRVVAV